LLSQPSYSRDLWQDAEGTLYYASWLREAQADPWNRQIKISQIVYHRSRMPNKSFGKNANTVPVTDIKVATITNIQSTTCCLVLSWPLKSVKWNRQGRIMQIVKPASEPSRAIILSNDGTKIATMMIEIGRPIRITILRIPRVSPDMPVMASDAGSARASRPLKISRVLIMGRVLQFRQ